MKEGDKVIFKSKFGPSKRDGQKAVIGIINQTGGIGITFVSDGYGFGALPEELTPVKA